MTQRERQILQWIEADPDDLAGSPCGTRGHHPLLCRSPYLQPDEKGLHRREGLCAPLRHLCRRRRRRERRYRRPVLRAARRAGFQPRPRAHQSRRRRTKYCPQYEPARRGCPPADRLRRRPACTARCGLLRRARHRHQPRAAGARRHDVHLPFPERRRRRYGAWPFRHGYLRAHHPRRISHPTYPC